MAAPDESAISEIYIQPDGRIYVFGMSKEVLEILETLNPDDVSLRNRLEHVQRLDTPCPASVSRQESTAPEGDA